MKTRNAFRNVAAFLDTMASAVAVSNAVERGRHPRHSDLRNLGIEPEHFSTIRFR